MPCKHYLKSSPACSVLQAKVRAVDEQRGAAKQLWANNAALAETMRRAEAEAAQHAQQVGCCMVLRLPSAAHCCTWLGVPALISFPS